MALVNKKMDMTPFDMREKPAKQWPPLAFLLWIASYFLTGGKKMKREKINMKKCKPPYLVISTHQGFSDYFIVPRMLFPHRANYVSDMEGFAGYGKWAYKHGGCIGKRRYVSDMSVLSNIRYALQKLKQSVVIFPEARHADAGVTSSLPDNLGKLAKILDVPVVTISINGSYLANPFWDETRGRKVPFTASMECLFTREDLHSKSEKEIQEAIAKKLEYNEYEWQKQNGIKISEPFRAEGLHLPLYKCRECGCEGQTVSSGAVLSCKKCGASWTLLENGELESAKDKKLISIPEWYQWERENVRKEIKSGSYKTLNVPVRIEALPNHKGFVPFGEGRLIHDMRGYTLILNGTPPKGTRDSFPLFIDNRTLGSTQTEYKYRNRGKCIVLSTRDCCYYAYSDSPDFLVTKLEFAVEEMRKIARD
ncbi:MAG: lysophospholipid acyltransferase family protein [Treponema sp.]|nr:lysophospholipid acyltransferase family protein [Treponema sp.]